MRTSLGTTFGYKSKLNDGNSGLFRSGHFLLAKTFIHSKHQKELWYNISLLQRLNRTSILLITIVRGPFFEQPCYWRFCCLASNKYNNYYTFKSAFAQFRVTYFNVSDVVNINSTTMWCLNMTENEIFSLKCWTYRYNVWPFYE